MPLLVPSGPASSLELILPGQRYVGFCGTCPLGGVGRLPPLARGRGCRSLLGGTCGGTRLLPRAPRFSCGTCMSRADLGRCQLVRADPDRGRLFFFPPLFAGAVGCEVTTYTPSRPLFFSVTRRARRCPDFAAGVAVLCSVSPPFRFARLSCRVGSAGPGVRVAHAYRGAVAGVGGGTSHCCITSTLFPAGSPMYIRFVNGRVFPPRSQERRRVFTRCGLARRDALRPVRVYHSASGSPHVSFHGKPAHICLELANIVQRLSQEVHPIVKLLGEPPVCLLRRAHLEEGD